MNAKPHNRAYLEILRDTIRRELDLVLWTHLVDRKHCDHYFAQLQIKPAGDLPAAKKAVEGSPWINDWFDLDVFWAEQGKKPSHENILTDLLIALHGFWLLRLNDTRHTFEFVTVPTNNNEWREQGDSFIHFGKGVHYKDDDRNEFKRLLKSSLKNYQLRSGEGSVGLSLRADRGVCLRNTIRDIRGAVALEDCLIRNLSYMGFPIFAPSDRDTEPEHHGDLGYSGRPIGHFGLFFPCPLGWHVTLEAKDWCDHCVHSKSSTRGEPSKQSPHCLYQLVYRMCETIVKPVAAEYYRSIASAQFQDRVRDIGSLANDPVFLRGDRENGPGEKLKTFLRAVIPPSFDHEGGNTGQNSVREESSADLTMVDDFQAVQIWERHAGVTTSASGQSAIHRENTWRHSVRWKYPEVFLRMLRNEIPEYVRVWDSGAASDRLPKSWGTLKAAGGYFDVFQLGEADRLVVVGDCAHAMQDQLGTRFSTFWNFARKAIAEASAPTKLQEFHKNFDSNKLNVEELQLNKAIQLRKWTGLILTHVAQRFCARIVGNNKDETRISEILADAQLYDNLQIELEKVQSVDGIQSAFVVVCPAFHVVEPVSGVTGLFEGVSDSIRKHVEDRIRKELSNQHTLAIFEALAELCDKRLDTVESIMVVTNHASQWRNGVEWPIQSEGYRSTAAKPVTLVDCGAETAFSVPSIWKSWWNAAGGPGEPPQPCLDLIHLSKVGGKNEIQFLLSSSTASPGKTLRLLLRRREAVKCVHRSYRLLAETISERLRSLFSYTIKPPSGRSDLRGSVAEAEWSGPITFENDRSSAERVKQAFDKCLTCDMNRGEHPDRTSAGQFYILLADIGGVVRCQTGRFSGTTKTERPCPCDAIHAIEADLLQLAKGGDTLPLGSDSGLFVHVFFPLCRPQEHSPTGNEILGFIIFSTAQQEPDTIHRVSIRPVQQALITFATDYLEYALGHELAQHELEASLQDFSHALRNNFLKKFANFDTAEVFLERIAKSLPSRDSSILPLLTSHEYKHPSGTMLESNLANFYASLRGLDNLDAMLFDTALLLNAQTYILSRQREQWPAHLKERSLKWEYVSSITSWLKHVVDISLPSPDLQHAIGMFDVQYDPSLVDLALKPMDPFFPDSETPFPLGSMILIIQEIIGNSCKHAPRRPDTQRLFRFSGQDGKLTLKMENAYEDLPSNSTKRGHTTIRDALAANFGKKGTSWDFHASPNLEKDKYIVLLWINVNPTRYEYIGH
jgi:hypothetical protein